DHQHLAGGQHHGVHRLHAEDGPDRPAVGLRRDGAPRPELLAAGRDRRVVLVERADGLRRRLLRASPQEGRRRFLRDRAERDEEREQDETESPASTQRDLLQGKRCVPDYTDTLPRARAGASSSSRNRRGTGGAREELRFLRIGNLGATEEPDIDVSLEGIEEGRAKDAPTKRAHASGGAGSPNAGWLPAFLQSKPSRSNT